MTLRFCVCLCVGEVFLLSGFGGWVAVAVAKMICAFLQCVVGGVAVAVALFVFLSGVGVWQWVCGSGAT